MNYYRSCLILGILGCSFSISLASAKQPVAGGIGNIQNKKEAQGSGCILYRKGKQKEIVFWSAFENSALMNIDGKDRRIPLVSETPSLNRIKKGDRSTAIYKSDKINVRIDRVATRVCPVGSQECEATSYNAKIKLNIGERQQVIAVEGDCGS
ncbi:hypothetical protein [Chamaesiphon minutus]|uniref:Uncharacterized protein n=1 Tax=Chamaesiphon minutus (strain ATCC 27169 / PCC 6605) TaxID=1173020 RepID=K9UKP8_CHAP6|nr:hypothetical protein [Chamaesiphon minutus]AFY95233.1 hypothetical protein Cha6605_4293 [Chamaesiphon minutus PCC 6605]